MGRVNVERARSTGSGLWKAMLIGLLVIVIAAFVAYFVFAGGTTNYAPNATSAPATNAPAPAAPAVTSAPVPRYP